MTVFVDVILFFCPGFLATVAVLGNRSLPSVEVTNFCGGCFVPKDKNFLNRFSTHMRFVKIIAAFYTRAEFWHEIQSQLSLLLSDRSKIGLRVNR